MESLYIYNGGTLKRKDNTIQFVFDDNTKRDLPIEGLKEIYVMCEIKFNTNLINFLAKNGVMVHFFNYYSYYTGSFCPKEERVSGSLLVKQVEFYSDFDKRLNIAKKFIKAASANIYRNLRYYNGRGKDLQEIMLDIEYLRKQIDKAQSIQELMGYEGNIRKKYYAAWPIIINQDIDFQKRVKNPPDNMINTLISFVNSIIYNKTLSEIYKTQLNPTISFLHEPGNARFSLSLDISEIFKPLIGDRLIFSLLNRNQINEKSFIQNLNYLSLDKKAVQLITSELNEKLNTTITHKDLGRKVTYQHLIRLECYKLIKHLLGEKEYEGFEIWW